MSGDMGDLKGIIDLKKKYKFRLLVDDAHGFGTMGKTGAGAGEEQGVQDQIDLYFLHLCQIHGQHWCFHRRRQAHSQVPALYDTVTDLCKESPHATGHRGHETTELLTHQA